MGRLMLPLPPKVLRANRRSGVHWGAVQGAKASYKAECEAIIRSVRWGAVTPGVVPLVVVVWCDKGERMPDLPDVGYWGKQAIDSMVQCGVFENDSPTHLRPFLADARRGASGLELLWGEDAREYAKGVL